MSETFAKPSSQSFTGSSTLTTQTSLTKLESQGHQKKMLWTCAMLFVVGGLWLYFRPKDTVPVETSPVAQAAAELAVTKTLVKEELKPEPAPINQATPRVQFSVKSAKLSPKTRQCLDAWAEQMKHDRTSSLQINGHADERGTAAYNQRLSTGRALAVKAYLQSKGVARNRLHTASFGRSRPIVRGHSESAWAQNRRVELKFMNTLSQR